MTDLLYFFALGVLALTVSLIMASVAFAFFQRHGTNYARLVARLPDAVRYEDLMNRVADLQSDRDHLAPQVAECRHIIAQANDAKRWLADNSEAVQRLEFQRSELERIEAEHAARSGDLEDLRSRLDARLADLARVNAEVDGARQRCIDLQTQLADLTSQRDALAGHIETDRRSRQDAMAAFEREMAERREHAAARFEDLQRDIDAAHATRSAAVQDATAAERTLAALQAEVDAAVLERNTLWPEVRQLQSELAELESSVAGLRGEKSAIEQQIETLERILRDLDARVPTERAGSTVDLSELWVPAIHPDDRTSMDALTEVTALERVKDNLRNRGLVFPDRIIHAFHTSLKVAMDAPLLVLAGISGTGKSLLPRCYAEAMGMHFLAMPVQPRWDGPQDLLGFRNHLEGGFKPTDLTRALIQMDRRRLKWHGDHPHRVADRMLLVLLDEMNLARVEYYFSEFLSRLEVRREQAGGEPEDLCQSALQLDLGVDPSGDPSFGSLVVWNNVLFVGTMNEDESTLSLSDKVLDRANMIRFGKPNFRQAQAAQGGAPKPASQYLSYQQWRQWGIDTPGDAQATEWIDQLQEILTPVNRGFGWRTRRAILAYTHAYPQVGDAGARPRLAMADQIEQRVLPRLRGLDAQHANTQQAIGKLIQLSDNLGDPSIARTLEQMRRSGEIDGVIGIAAVQRDA